MAKEIKKDAKANATAIKKKKAHKNLLKAIVSVHASFNNTLVALTNEKGEIITWSSGGNIGYKGSKKSTPYAAQLAVQAILKTATDYGIKEVGIRCKGIGPGKDAAIKAVQGSGFTISTIRDLTSAPHNGCRKPRPPKK